MGTVYASVSDITALGISLTAQQTAAAEVLLEQASAKLRTVGRKYGKEIDIMIADPVSGEDTGLTVKNVIVQAVLRALNSIDNDAPAASALTQSGLGYSATMTYFNAGQSLYFLKSELKDLGLMRQTYGAVEVYNYGSAD